MKLEIYHPGEVSKKHFEQLCNLISEGGQVDKRFIETGIPRARFVGIVFDSDLVISTATIKKPLHSYIQRVFEKAGVPDLFKSYQIELGYIVTRVGYEGKGHSKALLSEILPLVSNENVFATTRNDSMGHILRKYGFSQIGKIYSGNLKLFVKPAI